MIITLASRYAIEGGLESEIAYTLAESYIMRVEKCGHPQTAEYIAKEAEMEYARLVHELHEIKKSDNQKAHKNPIIQECKDYICTHLHGKITVSELANELHVSESYLSSLFKKTDGRSIVEYINQHKVQLVKNLLIYSDYSFIDIANYLGFCSQSHLGAVFKAETGTTLSRYRRSNANRGFDKQIS
jgi:AraC-like DNA-binding protein